MIVVCTGMSGSGRKSAICAMLNHYKPKNVKLINIGEKMYEKSKEVGYPISEGKILDCSEKDLDYLRAIVYEDILREKADSDTLIINTHACFRWNKYITKAFDYYYLTKLNPDLYITITDTIYSIYGRLEGSIWKGRNALWELLAWRDEEEHITKTFAMIQKKKHFTIGREEPPETLFNIIFNPSIRKTYLSYPISAGDADTIDKVRQFRDTLRKNAVVFDPLAIKDIEWLTAALAEKKQGKETIDIPFKDDNGNEAAVTFNIKNLEAVEDYLKDQTINRDYNMSSQSDFVTVFYHDPTINSPGVQREIRYSKENGKNVYFYYPKKEMSPFLEKDITEHFLGSKELIDFLTPKVT